MARRPADMMKRERLKMGWTQADLARECEMDRSVICRAEQGKGVSTHLAAKLSEKLGYPVEAWLGEGRWSK